jgi:MoaA/NifB/PqqE/SkfB family radical SAM enzyme
MTTTDAATTPTAVQEPAAFRSALISTAGHCKVACGFCFRADRGHGFLDLATYTRALSRLKEIGVESVCLTGGEPTHHPELRQLVRLAHQFGLPVSMVTSARTEAEVSRLAPLAHLLQNVTVSADSRGAMTLGRTTRSVDTAIRTLQRLDTQGKILHLTYWKLRSAECAEIAEQVAAADVDIQLSPVALDDAGIHRAGLSPSAYQVQQRSDAETLGRRFVLGPGFHRHLDRLLALQRADGQGHLCRSPTLYLSASGDLRHCPYGQQSISVHEPRVSLAGFLSRCPTDRVTPECAALCRTDD